jgi:three-Cys-motif partner protein
MIEDSRYIGREQTKIKHFILKAYLQELAFKILTISDLTYVDAFSGPWNTTDEGFSDSSFMIAIGVLKDAQRRLRARGMNRKIRSFLCERDPGSFQKLQAAVRSHDQLTDDFFVRAFNGEFIDAVPEIVRFSADSFVLTFIDPTGWTGFGFDKIKPLLMGRKHEVLINFMYDFANRATAMPDPRTIASFDPILGGPGWRNRLDPNLPRGAAVEQLFRSTLKNAGGFDHVVSMAVLRSAADRTHFFLTYGTKSIDGLKAFRETEFRALREQAQTRVHVKLRKREERTATPDLFAESDIDHSLRDLERIVAEQELLASAFVLEILRQKGGSRFDTLLAAVLDRFSLRQSNLNAICRRLAKTGGIENSWGGGNRAPKANSIIRIRNMT